jgi:hypothetical protein
MSEALIYDVLFCGALAPVSSALGRGTAAVGLRSHDEGVENHLHPT